MDNNKKPQRTKPPLHNLYNLLQTPESRKLLSLFTGIQTSKIDKWFDPNSKTLPKADELLLMAKFFGCSTDYLMDLVGQDSIH